MKRGEMNIYSEVLRGQKTFYAMVVLVEMIAYTFSFLISGLLKKDIFNVLEGKTVTLGIYSLKVLIGLNVGVPLLINFVKQMNSGLAAKVEIRLKKNTKIWLLDSILDQRLGTEHARGHGEAVSFFRNECNDVVALAMEYGYQLPKITLCAAILVMMVYVSPVFTAISLIPTFGMAIFMKYLGKRISTNREASRKSTSNLTEYLENLFGNIEYFKMAANSEKLAQIFREKCKKRSKYEIRDRVLDKVLSIFSVHSANLVMGIVLVVAIPFYRKGLFTIGDLVMFEYYYAFLASLPDAVGKLIRMHRQARVSITRIEPLPAKDYTGGAQYINAWLKVKASCNQGEAIVQAHRGEVILLRGGSEGLRSMILQRLFQVCAEDLPKLRCKYVPQQPVLFQDSVVNNICFGEDYEEQRLEEAMEKTDLLEEVKGFKDGICTNVGKQGSTVSGGQRKRIGIARALYSGSDILFIDGLAESVDKRTEEVMVSRILEQVEGIIFIASDSRSMLGKATQVIDCQEEGR